MKIATRSVLSLALALATAAAVAQSTAKGGSDDASLQQSVQQQLSSSPVFADVKAAAHNGKVTLTGTVPTKEDRQHAKDQAKAVPGVKDVKDHLTITAGASGTGVVSHSGAANSTSPATSSGQNGDAGQNTAGSISGNSGTNAGSQTNTAPDSSTPQKPGAQQAQPQGNSSPQLISANPAGARLVYAAYQQAGSRQEAASSNAKPEQSQTPPAAPSSSVSNPSGSNASPAQSPDDANNLQAQIDSAIRNEPTLTNSHVAVAVSDSTIDLSGTVPTGKDKITAERIARSYGSNRKVNNKLMVTGHGHSDMAPDHPAMNNSGTGNAVKPNPPGSQGTNGSSTNPPPQN